jgi:hypothetical protein
MASPAAPMPPAIDTVAFFAFAAWLCAAWSRWAGRR